MAELRIARPPIGAALLVLAGCATVSPPVPGLAERRFAARERGVVAAAVYQTLAALGATVVPGDPADRGGTATVRAVVVADGIERHPFVIHVEIGEEPTDVRVAVHAELLTADSPLVRADRLAPEPDPPARSCSCPPEPNIDGTTSRQDAPLVLAQQRRLVRDLLAGLDARLAPQPPAPR